MIFFRRIYKLIAVNAWSAYCVVRTIPYRFRGWDGKKEIIARFGHMWARGMAGILNLRVRVFGDRSGIPVGLIVSNHLGYLDIITHGVVFPLRYVSKKEIAKWPIVGWIVKSSQSVFVDRASKKGSRQALRDFAKTMKHGIYLIVYPEGTSTDGENGILPFKSTAFEAAIYGDMPITPILTLYKEKRGRDTVCWYGDMTFFPHFWRVLGLSSIRAEVHILPVYYPGSKSRKEAANDLHDLMDKEYRKLCRKG
ncbi:MAG: lysophospholipid acyltransferase family protein [Candidatus Omnitrophota bacterium]